MVVRSLLRAPGVQAMEKGQQWIVPGNQYRSSSTTSTLQLESIHTIFQSTKRYNACPPSPVSAFSESVYGKPIRQPVECVMPLNPGGVLQEVHSEDRRMLPLTVPRVAQMASGGCFDPDNWIFQIVWGHIRHMSITELMSAYFYREDRGKYGENHTSTRGVIPFGEDAEETERKIKGSENHRFQEQGRRVRHRYLQAYADENISTFILEMAQKEMSKIKATIQSMNEKSKTSLHCRPTAEDFQQEEKIRGTSGAGKKLGKDDQLTAALMSQHVAFVLISRLDKELTDAREELTVTRAKLTGFEEHIPHRQNDLALEERVKTLVCNDDAVHWQQQCGNLEAERRRLEDEVIQLRHQLQEEKLRNKSFVPPLLPLPVNTHTKRQFDRVEASSMYTAPTEVAPHSRQAKRRHLDLQLPPVHVQVNGRNQPPPSPSPSCDESSYTSFGSNVASPPQVHYAQQ